MAAMNEREKRLVRFAAIAMAVYLALFFGFRAWKQLEARRAEYRELVFEAERVQREVRSYGDKLLMAQKLRDEFRLAPEKLSRSNLVAEASAAIQQTAKSGGLQIGPVRESPARSGGRELTSVQIEGAGRVPAVMGFLHRIRSAGYPLVIDSIQVNPEPGKPGNLKVSLTVAIVDFEQWNRKGTK